MIKINLANAVVSTSLNPGGGGFGFGGGDAILVAPDEARKEALKRILIIAIFPLGLYVYEMQNLPNIRGQLGQKTQYLSELQAFNSKTTGSVAEIKKFKEDEAKIQARISILEKLSRDRQKEIRILDLFQQVIPEKVWFTRIEVVGTKLQVAGYAMSDYDVSSFMESLSKSIFLADVNLVSSNEQVIDGVSVKRFEISCLTEKAQ